MLTMKQVLGFATFSSHNVSVILMVLSLMLSSSIVAFAGDNLYNDLHLSWGGDRCKISDNGKVLTATLDKSSGSGFESKEEYQFVNIDMQIKLVKGDAAGTVTTFYLSSKGDYHDEIDFEFLGNVSGDPYTVHTNVFCNGKGNKEQQFRLWFNPSEDFHTYSIQWTPRHILFLVDGIAIREYKNLESEGICFPKNQAMKLYSSIWNADDWATRGGLVKTDWSKGPFKAYYKKYGADNACVWNGIYRNCRSNSKFLFFNNNGWLWEKLDSQRREEMIWKRNQYMVYDYCKDTKRFPQAPKECYLNNKPYY